MVDLENENRKEYSTRNQIKVKIERGGAERPKNYRSPHAIGNSLRVVKKPTDAMTLRLFKIENGRHQCGSLPILFEYGLYQAYVCLKRKRWMLKLSKSLLK